MSYVFRDASFRLGLWLVTLLIPSAFHGASASGEQTVDVKNLLLDPVDAKRERTVPLKLYWTETKQPKPVILFSHGLGGSREGNPYLGNHWARGGYIVVFMQHAGSDNAVWKSVRAGQRMASLKSAASVANSRDRFADVPFVIDQLEVWNRTPGHALEGKLNLEQLGMSGHSYGAVTTLAAAGRKYPLNRDFGDERIDAFVALSPSPGKGLSPKRAFGSVKRPVLCMTGTKDGSPIDPSMKPAERQEVFDAMSPGDKFQLVLAGGHHFSFSDSGGLRQRNPKHHPAIQAISLRFWDAYLKGDESAKQWLKSESPIEQSGLSEDDKWQWK